MVPEIGHFASVLALLMAVTQAVVPVLGAARGQPSRTSVSRWAGRAQFTLLIIAFWSLAFSFVANDFSVLNVASNSHSQLPTPYRFAATWGSHEGSLLLWTLMLGFWTAAVTWFTRALPAETVARVLGVMGAISTGFLLFMLLTSNPFLRLAPAPPEGLDLNPLLQDLAMVVHPPLLYMGYVGFSVAFSFAIAALSSRRLDAAWARWSRPWTILAWVFLTCGIALGSFWAYYELGWGGWWFWDPVENASFMPWLVGTALIHSLAVTDKRASFRSWTVLLAIATFSLSLLGAFLVRSGVLTSVHAFATDPKRGVFLLCFLAIVIGGSLLLYAWRAGHADESGRFDVVSRESLLLSNNVLLAVAAGSVLLGTLYPLFIDVLGKGKLSVGPPYFNLVFVAVMTPAMFLLGVGPIANWKKASVPELAVRLRWALAGSTVASFAMTVGAGQWKPLVGLGLLLALWIVLTTGISLWDTLRMAGGWTGIRSTAPSRPRSYYGMHLAHVGVAVSIVGITVVTGYQVEKDLRMDVGDQVNVAGYEFTFRGVKEAGGPNYLAARADIDVSTSGRRLRTLHPEKRVYYASLNAMTETAIDSGLFRDLYLALGEPLGEGSWSVRIQYKPFVAWIWGGAVPDGYRRWTGGQRSAICPGDRQAERECEGLGKAACAGAGWPVGRAVMKRALPLGVFMVLSAFLTVGLRLDPHHIPSPLIDRPAPAFSLAQLHDQDATFAPAEMLGRVWLLNVWASWCVSCRDEHAVLNTLARTGLVPIYGLAYKDNRENALAFLGSRGNPYVLSIQDVDGRVGIDYGVYGVPESYLIDKAGVVRFKHIGPITSHVVERTILPMVERLSR